MGAFGVSARARVVSVNFGRGGKVGVHRCRCSSRSCWIGGDVTAFLAPLPRRWLLFSCCFLWVGPISDANTTFCVTRSIERCCHDGHSHQQHHSFLPIQHILEKNTGHTSFDSRCTGKALNPKLHCWISAATKPAGRFLRQTGGSLLAEVPPSLFPWCRSRHVQGPGLKV